VADGSLGRASSDFHFISVPISLIGLEPLIESYCKPDLRYVLYNTTLSLDSYLNPFALFFAYFALALTTKHLIRPRVSFNYGGALSLSISYVRWLRGIVRQD